MVNKHGKNKQTNKETPQQQQYLHKQTRITPYTALFQLQENIHLPTKYT